MKVTKENFSKAMGGLFYAHLSSDYNSECVSTSAVLDHIRVSNKCQKAIEDMRVAGYEPKYLLEPVFKEYVPSYVINSEPNPNLKNKVDSSFEIIVDGTEVEWGLEWYYKDQAEKKLQSINKHN